MRQLVAMTFFAMIGAASVSADPLPEQRIVVGPMHREFMVEVADTTETRATGLSDHDHLAPNEGMLFVYTEPQKVRFWMLGMSFPIDMVFIDDTQRISKIEPDVQPSQLWPVSGPNNTIAVLEINAGAAERAGLQIGDTVTWSLPDQP
ncbi:DUF192 domain-containing protein [Roseobacter weihaiensis]|uniref:DUF192 domain-containing protein n=1 Tax=Roseobacter weihaiensis TaxID=2763262 RepID=UPI001D0ABF06|nr:DUF192 domain-containing protein [Roseobacter sp. H9]